MIATRRTKVREITVLGCLLLAGMSSGCQGMDTLPSHTACYEHDGMWCSTFDIGFEEARTAVRGTLVELKMPNNQEGPERFGTFIDTRTPDNFECRVMILPPSRRVPGTRICVRVGGFGTHRKVAEHLLEEIARRLDAYRHIYAPTIPAAPPGSTPGSPPVSATPPPQAPSLQFSLPPEPIPMGQK
jgi:hypothetical protein